MVMTPRNASAKPVWTEWREFRQQARENEFSPTQFSDSERVAYDLDTARITGRENRETYTVDRPIDLLGSNYIDIRTLYNR